MTTKVMKGPLTILNNFADRVDQLSGCPLQGTVVGIGPYTPGLTTTIRRPCGVVHLDGYQCYTVDSLNISVALSILQLSKILVDAGSAAQSDLDFLSLYFRDSEH